MVLYIYIWATVNIWYIAPSHQFLKSVLSFFRFWYISKCYRFLKSVLSFSKPQLNFQKIETARILLSINLNFGCSSYNLLRPVLDLHSTAAQLEELLTQFWALHCSCSAHTSRTQTLRSSATQSAV